MCRCVGVRVCVWVCRCGSGCAGVRMGVQVCMWVCRYMVCVGVAGMGVLVCVGCTGVCMSACFCACI